MLTINTSQKERFKNILNKPYSGVVKYISIIVLNNVENIIEYLLINNTSFNFLIDKDGIYELVPDGYATNGGYKLSKTICCNDIIEHLTIGVITDNELDMMPQLLLLKEKLISFATDKMFRLAIGNNVEVKIPDSSKPEHILYKKVSKEFVIDTIFHFFSPLFIV